MDPPVAKNMLHGQSDALDSAFRLNYAMILNLMRVEGAEPESLIQSSFAQFQNDRALPGLEAKIVEIERDRDAVQIKDEAMVDEYVKLKDGLDAMIRERRVVDEYADVLCAVSSTGSLGPRVHETSIHHDPIRRGRCDQSSCAGYRTWRRRCGLGHDCLVRAHRRWWQGG